MLLAWPFLVQAVSKHGSYTTFNNNRDQNTMAETSLSRRVCYSCVDSAIRTVDLLSALKSNQDIPKRLLFVANTLFVASLVLGVAQFSDLDLMYPLGKSLSEARKLLVVFTRYDTGSERNLVIVDNLQAACDLHLERRFRRKMERQSLLIEGLFGTVHDNHTSQSQRVADEVASSRRGHILSAQPESHPAPEQEVEAASDPNVNDCGSPSILAETGRRLNFGIQDMIPDFEAIADLVLPLSPMTLVCEPLDNPYANTFDFADMMFDESGTNILEQQDI